MKKYSVTVYPLEKTQSFDENTLLLDALTDMGVMVKTPCGGKGVCGKCRVKVKGELSALTEQERRHAVNNERLACQAKIVGDVHVFVEDSVTRREVVYHPVDREARYGIAVDIGTTTVQVRLVHLEQSESFLIGSFLNPQRRYGHDVIARITVSDDPQKYQELVHLIQQAVATLLLDFSDVVKLSPEQIDLLVFSGNTTMMHFLFNLDVSTLGVYPFTVSRLDFDDFRPDDIAVGMFSNASVFALPAVSAYLGSDLIGGLTLSLEKGFHRNVVFIDMGTNGEIFMINSSGEIYAASCAMGPALEGMNISSGMTADAGAITHIGADNNKLDYEMLGESIPVGMCGTALIDIIAHFLRMGVILPSGAFSKEISNIVLPPPAQYLRDGNSKMIKFWNEITLTQKDIRNVQLAKGASLSAALILLDEAGCSLHDIEQVLIAGAFGQHLDIENFKQLHFLPDFPNAEYHFLGNSSLMAAERACVDPGFLEKARNARDRVQVVELSAHTDFNKQFVEAIKF